MSGDKYYDRLSQYFEGELSEKDRLSFEAELEHDPKLQVAYQKYELALEAVDLLSEQKMKGKMHQWRNEATYKTKRIALPQMIRSVAAALFLLVLGYAAYQWIDPFSQDDLFESFGQPFEGETVRSGQDADFIDAMTAYNNSRFEEAVIHFKSIEEPNDMVLFYLGHSNYLDKKFEMAEAQFREIILQQESAFLEEAEWGLIACLYKQEKRNDEFQEMLNKIAQSEQHSFNIEALELIDKLEINFQ